VRAGAGRTLDDELTQRLAQLQPRRGARLVRERHDAADVGDLVEQRLVGRSDVRPAGEVHRLRPVGHEIPPEVVGEERHDRRDDAQRLHERVPERLERLALAVPETPPRAPDVPVRQLVDIGVICAHHIDCHVRLVPSLRLAHERVCPLDEPAVERLQVARRLELLPRRPEAVDVRVRDEERDGVPERQQLTLDLLRRAEAEQQVAVGRLRAELATHHIGAHALERVLRRDRVAPGAVHLTTRLVEHLLVAQYPTERRTAGEHDGHEELRVEPQPDLLAHLRHPVGGEPLLPVRVIREIGVRQPARGPRRVPLVHPCRVLPAERRERDDAGVEPDVADLVDAHDGLVALLATDRHAVDPRAAQLLQLVEALDRARLELGARADHVQMAARARVERQRQPVVAAAARCSSRPCCAASRPCACPCIRASTRPLHSRRASAGAGLGQR